MDLFQEIEEIKFNWVISPNSKIDDSGCLYCYLFNRLYRLMIFQVTNKKPEDPDVVRIILGIRTDLKIPEHSKGAWKWTGDKFFAKMNEKEKVAKAEEWFENHWRRSLRFVIFVE